MLRLPVLVLACSALISAGAAPAASAATYKGQATSTDTSFTYGAVKVVTKGAKVTKLTIESVTTTGCGGFLTLVFAPADADTEIVKGSAKIKRGKLSVTYRPDKTVEDQTTTIKATFKGSRVTGTFSSGSLCVNEGRFTAKR